MKPSILIHLFFIIFGSSSVLANLRWDFVYWESPPFIYKDSNGNLTGIVTDIYDNIRRSCKIPPVFVPRANLKNYTFFGEMLKNESITNNYKGYPVLEEATGSIAAWFPVLQNVQDSDQFVWGKGLQRSVLFDVKEGIAVFALRDKISFTYKVFEGMKTSKILFLITALMVFVVSGFTWICERFGSECELDKSFVKGSLGAIWVVVYTTVTVGYGNVNIRTLPGRVISVPWMVSSIIIAALLTSTVYDSMTKTRYLNVKDSEVAALAGSTEAHIAKKIYKAKIKGYNSYQDILNAVRDGEVTLGIMNYYTAGYYHKTMNQDPSVPALAIVEILESQVPIYILTHQLPNDPPRDIYYCFHRHLLAGIEVGRYNHIPHTTIEKVYYAPLGDLFSELNGWTCTTIVAAVLIIIGFIFDLSCLVYSKSGGLAWKHNSNKDEAASTSEALLDGKQKPNNIKSLDECKTEFGELMTEISAIQHEMNELTKRFSQPNNNGSTNFSMERQSLIH